MRLLDLRIAAVLGTLASTAIFSTTVNAEAPEASASEFRWVVDMRGRPPFKRHRIPVETVDLASIEVEDANVATEVMWVREHTGRPPFKRRRVEVPVVDVASMEIDETSENRTTFRGRPPFRRHR